MGSPASLRGRGGRSSRLRPLRPGPRRPGPVNPYGYYVALLVGPPIEYRGHKQPPLKVIHFRALWLRAVGLTQGGLEPLRKLDRVVIRPEVHVEEPRHVHEAVVVDCRHVDAVLR